MQWLKRSFIVIFIAFAGIQFIPIHRNISTEIPPTDFMKFYRPPENIEQAIMVSCYDCHSNHTEYPWYSYIQPIGWIIQDDINKGKNQLNFSEWGNYSDRRKRMKLKSIISQIEDNKMPLSSYALTHSEAKLSEKEKIIIVKYISSLKRKL